MRDEDKPTVTTSMVMLEHVLPSPTGRDHLDHKMQPVIFPGSPVWQDKASNDTVHSRGSRHRPRHHDLREPSAAHSTRRGQPLTEFKGDEWEYVVVFAVVGVLWAIGVCLALYILRFPFRVYFAQATLIVVAPLVPLYWIVRQLFRCASRVRLTMDKTDSDEEDAAR